MVVDFGSVSDPSYFSFFEPHHGKDGWFHSVFEERVFFVEVDYIELESGHFRYFFNTEEEPLSVSFGIDVILQN